ncbi:hypothetical protein [Bacillus cereus]|uniref:hypothetical protein n=1 Tax=Bacillus cereus TaxID=1396 RepID=UPI00032FCEC7|nr:hypothetical protein [Bacillus cereus]EOO44225.1 hypothetical protein ICK_06482 [Bacillus cereus BAG1X2-2]EOP00376.1 hypothetical protein ICO_06332 [Bacillus cereus BAG2O-1]
MNTNEWKVEFTIGETKISRLADVSSLDAIQEEGKRVMVVNNAVSKIKKDTGINLRDIIEDVHSNAVIRLV